MREYSAISVSAADATSLANRLTEQAQQGWGLVEIVHTNDQVVAYLEREAGSGDASGGGTSGGAAPTGSAMIGADGIGSAAGVGMPGVGASATETVTALQDDAGNTAIVDETTYSMGAPAGGTVQDSSPGWAATGLSGVSTPSVGDSVSDAHDQASGAVGSATDSATSAVGGLGDSASTVGGLGDSASGAATGFGVSTDHSGAGDAGAHGSSGDASGGASDSQTPAAGVQGATNSSEGMAPAGWYADPAGRFELRYWDGTQWTEHVASGSEQSIDPPVKGND